MEFDVKYTEKKILCFGDSNTWGYVPVAGQPEQRYAPSQRWPGILQSSLPHWMIIEEGLNSRTTNVDDPDAAGKNGLIVFPDILRRHAPIDLVVIMLGTNDLKKKFNRQPQEIAQGIESLVSVARDQEVAQLLVASPPIPKLASVPLPRP